MNMGETILLPLPDKYFNSELDILELPYDAKQRVTVVRQMEIVIYFDGHNPPNFHVRSKDKSVDAKFKIEDGGWLSGQISSTDLSVNSRKSI